MSKSKGFEFKNPEGDLSRIKKRANKPIIKFASHYWTTVRQISKLEPKEWYAARKYHNKKMITFTDNSIGSESDQLSSLISAAYTIYHAIT